MERVTLYEFKSDRISIHIEARIEAGDLVIEGYDIGKTVEESWGDSDYEYSTTVKKENISSLCGAMKINTCNNDEILKEISRRFKGNRCFSQFSEFLDSHNIIHEGFSWS